MTSMMEGVIDLPKVPKANEGVVMVEIRVPIVVVLAMATTPAAAVATIRKRRRSNNILHHHHHVHHHPNIKLETVAMVILPLLLQAHDNNVRNGSRKQYMIQDQKNLVVI